MSQAGKMGAGGGGGGTPITSIVGDNGNHAAGPIVNLLTDINTFPYLNGTVSFNGDNANTITYRTWDSNENVGLGREVFKAGGPGGTIQNNTGVGWQAGIALDGGGGPPSANMVLLGYQAGLNLTACSDNAVVGFKALSNATTGSFNVALGSLAGNGYSTSESSNIVINSEGINGESNTLRIGGGTGAGNQQLNASFIAGITGIVVTGAPVLVSTGDQLGVVASSNRFKKDIEDMADASKALYKLRPVAFNWNKDSSPGLSDSSPLRQYGLIAEEAVEHVPHAVNIDSSGRAFNINYQDLIGMMINEIQRLNKRVESLEGSK